MKAHLLNAEKLRPHGKRVIGLTPAAIGPYVIPAVNLAEHLDAPNVDVVTCGDQATIPIVAAIGAAAPGGGALIRRRAPAPSTADMSTPVG